MLHLRRADAEGQRAEGAVGGGVGIAAHDGRAGQGEPLLGSDDVDDALAHVVHSQVGDAEFGDVLLEGVDLEAGLFVLDGARVLGGRYVVVGHGQGGFGTAHGAPGCPQALEGLRAGYLVDQVTVDVE